MVAPIPRFVKPKSASRREPTASLATDSVLASGFGRLRPKARLLKTIGAELISGETVAVIELIRNSFDADATRVELRFTKPHIAAESSLEIWDNGHGMSRETVLGPWLEPATDHKSEHANGLRAGVRSPSGRRRLGAKGVGRFATQRLGGHLSLETREIGSDTEFTAEFDWDAFELADGYLDEITIPWSERGGRRPSHGTSLFVSRLRDRWTPERFEKLRLGLARLLGPGFDGDTFELFVVVDGDAERIRPAVESLQPMYSLSGEIRSDGQCRLLYQDLSMSEPEVWERQVLWPAQGLVCGPFEFRINAWDLDRPALLRYLTETESAYGLRDFRRLIREHSGVSLYRDGFRILPYGEADNDWLRLDRRRVNNPTLRLSNNQLLGWVRLTADRNPDLRDQTNREGLVSNDAYSHLHEIVIELLDYLEKRRFTARRQMGLGLRNDDDSAQQDFFAPHFSVTPDFDGSEPLEQAEKVGARTRLEVDASRKSARSVNPHSSSASAADARPKSARAVDCRPKSGRLDALAAGGHLASLAVREVLHPLMQLNSELDLLRDLAARIGPQLVEREDLEAGIQACAAAVTTICERISRVRAIGEPKEVSQAEKQSLSEVVSAVVDLYLSRLSELEIAIEVVQDKDASRRSQTGDDLLTILSLVFEGLVRELIEVRRSRKLVIRVGLRGLVIAADPPIPGESEEFSIARRLLHSKGGTIDLVQDDHGTRFVIHL